MASIPKVLDQNTSYLKMGATVYKLTKVTHPISDVEKEVMDYYKKAYENATSEIAGTLATNVGQAQQAQLTRIEEFRAKVRTADIKLPPSLKDKPTIHYRGNWYEIKTLLYQPLKHITNKHLLEESLHIDTEGFPFPSRISTDTKLVIKLRKVPVSPLLLGYNPKCDILSLITWTFHSMDTPGKLCISNNKPSDIWKLEYSELEDFINTVNHFSLASSTVTCRQLGYNYSLPSIIKLDNIVSITKEEATAWRA